MFLIYIVKFSGRKLFTNLFDVFFKKADGGNGVSIVIRSISKNNYRRQ